MEKVKTNPLLRLNLWSSLWHLWQIEFRSNWGHRTAVVQITQCASQLYILVEADVTEAAIHMWNALSLKNDLGWGAWEEGTCIKKTLEQGGRSRWQIECGRRKKNYFQTPSFGNRLNYDPLHCDLTAALHGRLSGGISENVVRRPPDSGIPGVLVRTQIAAGLNPRSRVWVSVSGAQKCHFNKYQVVLRQKGIWETLDSIYFCFQSSQELLVGMDACGSFQTSSYQNWYFWKALVSWSPTTYCLFRGPHTFISEPVWLSKLPKKLRPWHFKNTLYVKQAKSLKI